jgi:hypothetical protein
MSRMSSQNVRIRYGSQPSSAEKAQRSHRVELGRPVQEAITDLKLLLEETDARIEIGYLPTI